MSLWHKQLPRSYPVPKEDWMRKLTDRELLEKVCRATIRLNTQIERLCDYLHVPWKAEEREGR